MPNNPLDCALRILHLEDDAADRELIANQLATDGLRCEFYAATNEAEFRRALAEAKLDLILSDFSLPGFDGITALAIAKQNRPEVPFVFVSGTIGEDRAVESMNTGAKDYVLKSRLDRLSATVRRAVEETAQIAERSHALAALRESEERFRQVTESIEEVFWLAEIDPRRIIYVSPAYAKIWGRPCEQLYSSPNSWLENICPEDRARVVAFVAQQGLGGGDVEYRVVRPDGSVRWINDRSFPIKDAGGKTYRVAGVAEDITARRQLEKEVRQAQKMEAVGQFAGGIAHDFNNVLAVIQMQASLLLSDPVMPARINRGMQMIMGAAERAASLTRQLLAFSHRDIKQARDIDPAKVIGDTANLLRRIVPENIALESQFAPGLPGMHADPAMVEQVVMNLVINARDAMPGGGRLVVSLDQVDAGADRVAVHPGVKPGRFVRLCVVDSGHGITGENLSRIFEPFFTTKESGRGTGLGLATVFRIVAEHHGWIEVHSEINIGTTFRVFFPAVVGAAAKGKSKPVPAKAGNGESILLLEDDAFVRALAREVLERFGYRVLEAANATAALHLWEDSRGDFDLLITDVILPVGLSGGELAQRLIALKPGLKVIYTSGYSSDVVAPGLCLDANRAFLKKPYSAEELAAAVRRHLDQPRAEASPRPQ
ncbi:MAG: sensor hybrid histidine kinase [Verrucomicrobia bacterium]|nr:sensor hybrid histidine kinase [Verrucomicrobiota bacterium]